MKIAQNGSDLHILTSMLHGHVYFNQLLNNNYEQGINLYLIPVHAGTKETNYDTSNFTHTSYRAAVNL